LEVVAQVGRVATKGEEAEAPANMVAQLEAGLEVEETAVVETVAARVGVARVVERWAVAAVGRP
jgi:hypothetical protein